MNTLFSFSCFLILSVSAMAQGPGGGPPGRPGGPGMGGPGMGGRGFGSMGPQALVTGAPYSAVEVVQRQETLADGNTIVDKRQANVFRDGQGRIRREETVTPPAGSGKQPYTMTTILDYPGGHRYVLDSSTMTAFEFPLRTPPPAQSSNGSGTSPRTRRSAQNGAQADVSRPNVVRTALTPQSVNGVMSSGVQHTETIPVGAIGNTRPIQTSSVTWVSTDLKVPVQIRRSDPRFGTSDLELTNIVQSEPSASLFVVPAGYTINNATGGGPRGQMRGSRPNRGAQP